MKLYGANGSCAVSIRILLERTGADYDYRLLDFANGEQCTPAYRAVNPKGKVPALIRPDGSLLTELPTIARWLDRHYPDAGLFSRNEETRIRQEEVIDFMVATVHMRGWTLFGLPQKFTTIPEAQAQVSAQGKTVLLDGLRALEAALSPSGWLFEEWSAADASLFYLCQVASLKEVLFDFPKLATHYSAMLNLPEVKAALS